ncbi:MAG: hypothetical protein ABIM30_00435 [candidate division WOR-3 bacterium]
MPVTTVGKVLIQHVFEDYKGEEMNKKTLKNYFLNMARKGKEHYINSVLNAKKIGDEISTLSGMSIGIDDLEPMEIDVSHIKDPFEAQSESYKKALEHKGAFPEMVKSGARGAGNHLSAILTTPVIAVNHTGTVMPTRIKNNYAKGLKPHEYYTIGFQTRNEVVESSTGVVEPGDVGKMLVANMHDIKIVSDDCGTTNGIIMSVDDPNIIDRFLAKDHPPFKAGALITPQLVRDISRKYKKVLVRSPLTCQAKGGLCKKCWGLMNNGHLPPDGMNIGFRVANVLSEPLVQFTLNARHGARFGSTQARLSGLKGIRQMLEFPPNFLYKTELAKDNEVVKKVEKLHTGAHIVYTDKNQYTVAAGLTPVKVGTKLKPGDAISNGIPYPPDVVRYKGLGEGRKYVADKLHEIYQEAGQDIDKRYFETLARAQHRMVKIWDGLPTRSIVPGEPIEVTHLEDALQKHAIEKNVDTLKEGDILAQSVLHHVAGTKLTKDMIDEIKKVGFKKVLIYPHDLRIEYVMKPIEQAPLLHPDVLAKLSYRYLKQTILEAPAFIGKSTIGGSSPIPTFMVGEELK